MNDDPRRWSDRGDAANDLERKLIVGARDCEPPEGEEEAVWAALVARLPIDPKGPPDAPHAPSVTPTAGRAGTTFGTGGLVALAFAVGLVATLSSRTALFGSIEEPVAVPADGVGPVHVESSAAEREEARLEPTGPKIALDADNQRALAPRESLPVKRRKRAPTAPILPETPNYRSGEVPIQTERTVSSKAAGLAEQSRLLELARHYLRTHDAQQALSVLDQVHARFPDGELEQERRALFVEAEFATGDQAGGSRAAAEFLEAYPDSPLASRVRGHLH